MREGKKAVESRGEKIGVYLADFALLAVTWSGLLRRSFNCDTLYHMLHPEADILTQIQDGRYLNALIDFVLLKLGLSTTTHTGVTMLFTILLLALALWLVQRTFLSVFDPGPGMERAAYYAAAALVFVNVLFIECMMFGECAPAFGFAYLFASAGIRLFAGGKWMLAFPAFLLATAGYQAAVVYAAILLTAYVYMKHSFAITAEAVREELVCLLMTLGAGFLNLMSWKLVMALGVTTWSRKIAGPGEVGEKLRSIGDCYVSLLRDSKGVLPGFWLPLLFLVLGAGAAVLHFARRRQRKQLLQYMVFLLLENILIFSIPLAQKYLYLPPRLVFVFYVMESAVCLVSLALCGGFGRKLLCWGAGAFLVIQVFFCGLILAERRVSNTLDETYARMVFEEIRQYEEETGIQVTKLAVVNDADCPSFYREVDYHTDQINERALGQMSNTLLNVVAGRNFDKVEMDGRLYSRYFEGKDWDYFNPGEQLVITGDTANWAIF